MTTEPGLRDPRLLAWLGEYLDVERYAFDDEALGIERARAEIADRGYTILSTTVPEPDIEALRAHWLAAFSEGSSSRRINWMPYLGEANCVGYQDDNFQCLHRACDFLWNPPSSRLTRGVGLYLHVLRNRIEGEDPLKGLLYSEDRYGVFITTSYYPPGRGWLRGHRDAVRDQDRLVHHVLPLTFKNEHYAGGGLFLVDKRGERVDVDAAMSAGSALFFDASCEHGVERIVAKPGGGLGRLQLFAIPTAFQRVEESERVYDDLRLRGLLRRKYSLAKNRVYQLLGRQAMR